MCALKLKIFFTKPNFFLLLVKWAVNGTEFGTNILVQSARYKCSLDRALGTKKDKIKIERLKHKYGT